MNASNFKGDRTMKEVFEFLRECRIYYLATVEGDQARVRPFGTVDIFEDKLYFQTGKNKKVADQLKANPKIEISATSPDGSQWIRLTGTAVLDDNVAAQEHMLDEYPHLKAMYTAGDGITEVYYIKDAEAQFCSFTAAPRTVKF